MSYDIIIVKKEVAEYCQINEINIGQLLENNSSVITSFSKDEIAFFNNYFLEGDNYLGKFKLISTDDMISTFDFKNEFTVTLYSNYISFTTGTNNRWDLLMLTADLMLQTNKNVIRYDFQDDEWE